jgi:excinuclease UvrABC nuclease subunit
MEAAADGEMTLDGTAPTDPGVYAFVLNDVVMYIGLTNNSLKTRLPGL